MSTHAHVYEGMFAYVKLIQLYVITNIKIYIYKQIYTHMHTYMRYREEGWGGGVKKNSKSLFDQ